jgi:hypothetical protein
MISARTSYRLVRSVCCARAESGHAAAPPSSVMNSRRLIASSQGQGSRIKYSRSWTGFRADHHSQKRPLEFSHDVTSSQDRHTDKRPACRVTSARTSSAPCPWACRSPPRQGSFCAVVVDTCAVVGPAYPSGSSPCDERPDCLLCNDTGQFAGINR